MSYTETILTIDLGAIAANYRLLQAKASGAECAAVVKANAYGLGLKQVAETLKAAGCSSFFVATLDEGIELRELLPAVNIYVLHGVQSSQENVFTQYGLIPVLNDSYQIALWNQKGVDLGKKLPAIVHVDTGMCRLGLSKRSALYVSGHPDLTANIDILLIMSHLACADEPDHYKNSRQYINFIEIKKYEPHAKLTLANSSGIFLGPKFHFDMVRPGAALYGINPTPENPNPMNTVVRLMSRILQIRDIDVTQTVGYGATYKALSGSRLAVIPLGYANGYLRSLSNQGYCVIAGKKAPVVGRVSMDLITVDVTHIAAEEVEVGTAVELLGDDCLADDIAGRAGSNAYELFTRLGAWFKRDYIY
jgi:alanine racemase